MLSKPLQIASIASIAMLLGAFVVHQSHLNDRITSLENQVMQNKPALPKTDLVMPKPSKQMVETSLSKQNYLQAEEITPNDIRLYGSLNARVTLTLFSDLDCPYCKKIHGSLKNIIDLSQGTINWEFKHFPLKMHNPSASEKAMLVECMATTYNNRLAWKAMDDLFAGNTIEALSSAEVNQCLEAQASQSRVLRDVQLGSSLGVTSTPVIVVTDNETGKQGMIKGYKEPEQILKGVQLVMGI